MMDREHNDQKFEDTKGLIRRHKSMKDREHNSQKLEDTKGLSRRHKSMKDMSFDYSFGVFKLLAIVFSVLH
jgi:hypothetical protein